LNIIIHGNPDNNLESPYTFTQNLPPDGEKRVRKMPGFYRSFPDETKNVVKLVIATYSFL
jgi:hypothetical protein